MVFRILCGAALALVTAGAAQAMPVGGVRQPDGAIIRVADGCGPGWWRGPYGHCRNTVYSGPLPGGGWVEPAGANGCPPGWWRGPYGHCRNTPFHGELPNGFWQ